MSSIPHAKHENYLLTFEDETGAECERNIMAVNDDQAVMLAHSYICGGEGLLNSFVLTNQYGEEIPFNPY